MEFFQTTAGQGLLLTCVGVLAGWINVIAGGGSMLTIPAMVFMGMPGPVANGTNRIAIVAQNVVAVFTFWRSGFSNLRLSITLALASLPGAVAGAMLGTQLDGAWFRRVLALIMLAILLLMLTGKKPSSNPEHGSGQPQNLLVGHLCMLGAGFWGGFIHIGVGFILMPILHRVMHLDLVRVNMHKCFIVLVYSVVALGIYAATVQIQWLLGAFLAVGNSIGGWLGARATISRGDQLIRWVFNAVLIAFVIKLMWPGAS